MGEVTKKPAVVGDNSIAADRLRSNPEGAAKLHAVRQIIARHMDEIKTLFKPGARITVIVEFPNEPDCDVILTDDDVLDAIAALLRAERRLREYREGLRIPGVGRVDSPGRMN
jgi:hypothetical protein